MRQALLSDRLSLTWDDIIARAEQGCYADMLAVTERNIHMPVRRGPILRIFRDDRRIVIETLWTAFKDYSAQGWRNAECTTIRMSDEVIPLADSDGSIECIVQRLCKVELFSSAHPHSTLEPHLVANLDAESTRKSRARQYQLPVDATWKDILAKMRDRAGDGGVSAEHQILIQEEAARFAAA